MMREFFVTKMEDKHTLCDLIEHVDETVKIDTQKGCG